MEAEQHLVVLVPACTGVAGDAASLFEQVPIIVQAAADCL
jgi:hypothetical protein